MVDLGHDVSMFARLQPPSVSCALGSIPSCAEGRSRVGLAPGNLFLKPLRQLIESVNATLDTQLDPDSRRQNPSPES